MKTERVICTYIHINKSHFCLSTMHFQALPILIIILTTQYKLFSKLFSDITPKCICLKKALFGNTIIIKTQKKKQQYIVRLEHEIHYTLQQVQQISYVQVVLSSHFHTTARVIVQLSCCMSF